MKWHFVHSSESCHMILSSGPLESHKLLAFPPHYRWTYRIEKIVFFLDFIWDLFIRLFMCLEIANEDWFWCIRKTGIWLTESKLWNSGFWIFFISWSCLHQFCSQFSDKMLYSFSTEINLKMKKSIFFLLLIKSSQDLTG